MRRLHWLLVGVICLLVAAPAGTKAQANQDNGEEDDFVRDVLAKFFGPNWNVFAHGGATTGSRFLLQGPIVPTGGQRSLRNDGGFNVGGGVGVDLLPRIGFRLSYTYTSSDLVFRTDDGDGSEGLDIDDSGKLRSHLAAIEIIRYMLPSRASITPYGSAGVLGAWWVLDEESALVAATGGSTQFRFGGLASFGLQFNMGGGLNARLEVASASVRNPFTGGESFRAFGGTTIDEPGRVNKTDFRLAMLYSFGKP